MDNYNQFSLAIETITEELENLKKQTNYTWFLNDMNNLIGMLDMACLLDVISFNFKGKILEEIKQLKINFKEK